MQLVEQIKSQSFLRIISVLTTLTLFMSIILSTFGAIGIIWIQPIAALTILLGTILLIFQILIILQIANKKNNVGWVLHRFAYVTLLVLIYSFLSIVGGTYLSTFGLFGGDIMIVSVMGYVMQASFGICISSVSYYFLQIDNVWREW